MLVLLQILCAVIMAPHYHCMNYPCCIVEEAGGNKIMTEKAYGCTDQNDQLKGKGNVFTWQLYLYKYTARIHIWHLFRRLMHYKRET